mmetsp:Transcript_79396/g.140098  ORF Transcript_79396/g.140098 Transcript_79396/m.140098 type:complete len:282 (+) Transcript_79396:533-1378(+)
MGPRYTVQHRLQHRWVVEPQGLQQRLAVIPVVEGLVHALGGQLVRQLDGAEAGGGPVQPVHQHARRGGCCPLTTAGAEADALGASQGPRGAVAGGVLAFLDARQADIPQPIVGVCVHILNEVDVAGLRLRPPVEHVPDPVQGQVLTHLPFLQQQTVDGVIEADPFTVAGHQKPLVIGRVAARVDVLPGVPAELLGDLLHTVAPGDVLAHIHPPPGRFDVFQVPCTVEVHNPCQVDDGHLCPRMVEANVQHLRQALDALNTVLGPLLAQEHHPHLHRLVPGA